MLNQPLRILSALLAFPLALSAAESNPAEAKLRESLRNTMLQLRTAQADRDTLQAEKAQWELEKQKLTVQLDAQSKQSAAELEEARAKLGDFETRSRRQEIEATQLREALEKWKAAQQQAAALAAAKEAERARLAQAGIVLQRRVDDQQAKNFAMYKLGLEILARYESFGLGTAIGAREPFIGTTRVRLENLGQDYRDKLQEQRVQPESGRAAPGQPSPVPRDGQPAPQQRKKPGQKESSRLQPA